MWRLSGAVALVWTVFALLMAGIGPALGDAIGAGTVSLGGSSSAQLSSADARQLALDATLRVSGRTCEGQMIGSGFVLDGVTITNRHLAEGATELKVDNPSGSAARSAVVVPIARRSTDLDLLSSMAVGESILQAADGNAAVGEQIFVAGHAGGGQTLVLAGTVHLYDLGLPWGYSGEVMLLDVSTTGGFSGGPVLDGEGRVVGILQGYSPNLDLSVAIPIETLRRWSESDDSAPVSVCP